MKGVVFDEFITMVEEVFGEQILDEIIQENIEQLPSGGSYTVVGTYDHNEILVMVTALSRKSKVAVSELVKAFGVHLSKAFSVRFPNFFNECSGAIAFFKTIDNHIHEEVHKLYPDAELPRFTYNQISKEHLELIYESSRDFSMLALGLIEGTAAHYKQKLKIDMTPVEAGEITKVRFDIIDLTEN